MKATINAFNRLFNIRTEEWPITLTLFLMAISDNAGFAWGLTISYAAFLQSQGAGLETLPWVIILISISSIVATSLYTPFVDKVPNDTLMAMLYIVECLGLLGGLLLLQLGFASLGYTFLYLWGFAMIALLDPHQATYFNGFYNTQTAKRTLPFVNAGYRVGGIIAGFTMPFLNSWFADPIAIVVIWLVTQLFSLGLVWLIPRLELTTQVSTATSKPLLTPPKKVVNKQSSFVENMREGLNFTLRSHYLRWMAVGTLLLTTLLALLEYRSTELLLNEFDSTTEMADFLAILIGVSNLIVVPLMLFGISRIIGWLGLGNASLIFPVGNFVTCASLLVYPSWLTAAIAYLNRTDFRLAFQFPIEGLLYNAVSARVKGRARAFVSGVLAPVGALIGGGLLVLFVFVIPSPLTITVLIGVLACVYLATAFVIRRLYGEALIKMLAEEDFSSLLSQEDVGLSAADPATLKTLEQKLSTNDDPQFNVFMANLICQIGGNEAVNILTKVVNNTHNPETRAGLVEVMVAADLQGKAVSQLYTSLLDDPHGNVRRFAIAGLERVVETDEAVFLNLAMPMLDDPDIEVRLQLLTILAQRDDFYTREPTVQALHMILAMDDYPNQQARGVNVLGKVAYRSATRGANRNPVAISHLLNYLADPNDQIRLQASLAVEEIAAAKPQGPIAEQILAGMTTLNRDPVERIRQAALRVYSRLGQQDIIYKLVESLGDSSSQVRATAIEALVNRGKAAIPIVHQKLDSPNASLRKTSAVVLSRINKQEFGSLIDTHITSNLLTIYRNYGYLQALSPYKSYTSIVVLRSALREESEHLLNEIFELLSTLHNPNSINIIRDSLHSPDDHIRANALEALETLTSPQTARLVGPLADPTVQPQQLIDLCRTVWEMSPPSSERVIDYFVTQTDNSWLRAVVVFALGEMGVKMQAEADESSSPKSRRGKRSRTRSQSLLNLMMSDTNGNANEVSSPAARLPYKNVSDIQRVIDAAINEVDIEVRTAAQSAKRMLAGVQIVTARLAAHTANQLNTQTPIREEEFMLSAIEKIIFLKEVPFFQGMTIDQLKTLSTVCEEVLFEEDTRIFNHGDNGGTLYVVVSGKVAIEQEGKRKGSFARLATINPHSYFGEMNLFDNSPHANSAIALQDTLALSIHREPLVALARQYPDLSLELINVLSQRLRELNDQVVGLTRTKPRELHKLFDQFE